MPKNYNSAVCYTDAKSQNKVDVCDSTKIKANWLTSIVLIVSLFFIGLDSSAQVSSSLNPTYGYTFSNISATYTSLGTTGTVFQSGTALNTNAVSGAIPLPFVFTFNGIKENRIFISNNGFITFGIAPTTTQLTPISTPNGYNGAIAGFACNTVLSTAEFASGEIRYGTKANGDFAVQFQDLGQSTSSEIRMTFQIILKADGKTIQIVYGPGNIGSSISTPCQVGLRGTNPQDFNNRTVASAGSWNTGGTAGTTNAQTAACTSVTVMPNAGRTFQWTPTTYTPTYLTTPFTTTQSFTTWTNGSGSNNVPSTNWATNGYGSASWQIDNVNASSAGWPNSSGSYSPADYNGVAFAHSARFNSFNAANSQVGYLDYYVNLSGATSFLSLDFHTINTTGSDILQVFLSTDGGATFNQIGANITASAVGWRAQKIPLGVVTSATSIIRFKGTADNGNTDIGIDNVRINNCTPAGNTFSNPINLGPISASVNYGGNNLTENCYTNSFNSTSTPGNPSAGPANDVFYKFQITECGRSLAIGACLTEFFSYIYLLDASGNTLDSDYGCDDNQPFNPTLVNLFLPIGTYYVVVSGLNASDTGNIGLSFTYTPGAGTPPPPVLACYQTATFNNATCAWVVTGTQPAMPTLACYQTATFNTTTCTWVITGTQPTTQSPNTIISEGFNTFSSLATSGWSVVNTSIPVGTASWSQGSSIWAAQTGASNSWVEANYNSVADNNTISNWLIAPQRLLRNGDVITFWTRTATPVTYPDRLQVRLSTAGAGTNPNSPTDVGSYTTLLADINPTLTTTGYPTTFTKYTLTLSGLAAPTNCRVAFRYFVIGGGPLGANSNTIGIDTFSITRALPPLACYESYVFDGTTCQYDVIGTQPAMPTLACYETAVFNNTTCAWVVSGTQPAMPTLACYQTAVFNNTTCVWDVSGTQPTTQVPYTIISEGFDNFSSLATSGWSVVNTSTPVGTASWSQGSTFWSAQTGAANSWVEANYNSVADNNTISNWLIAPQRLLKNGDVITFWTRTETPVTYPDRLQVRLSTAGAGTNPISPTDVGSYTTLLADINPTLTTTGYPTTFTKYTLTVSGLAAPANCRVAFRYFVIGGGPIGVNSNIIGIDTFSITRALPPLACYESYVFNDTTCQYDVTGTQPAMPTLACYETAVFNNTTCAWVVSGTQPAMPTLACYQTAVFNNTTCVWDVTGTQPTTQVPNTIISEGFDNFSSLATSGWSVVNTSTPVGTASWSQGSTIWPAQTGAANSWVEANFNSVADNNTISNWLIAPQRLLQNGDVITFWTRTAIPVTYPDRLQVRLSTAGAGTNPISPTDVGSYTTLLADINPTLTTTGYPTTFTKYTLTVSGLAAPANCRVAFRYFVIGGGPIGVNSYTIGIDTFSITRALPPLACYESYVFNVTTCQYDVTGTQPAMPTLTCYQTASFNTNTCTWNVSGTQPAMPTLACYQTATFNNMTCVWGVTGTQPAMPTLACYETASFNSTTCVWDVSGTQPVMPTIACYETAAFNTETCVWDVAGTQPIIPTFACYETAIFNSETCIWDVTGLQPIMPTLACYETATFNSETCVWDVTGTQPIMPTLACYETASFNVETCIWDVTGTQPIIPTLACYETATFNSETCVWDVTGTQPIIPTLACYETATFINTTCTWDVTGTQPSQPTLACYETASFNTSTCVWDVTGTQPMMPTLACYETATFNNTNCVWDVIGTQPILPTLACYETATFNNETCTWDVTGTQPMMPTLACYETATLNNTTCVWDVTGTQPIMPTLACYETATFNNETCTWDVTGTQSMMPTLACYETATFNNTTCVWDVTGTQPSQPTLACYETASFNTSTCVWDVTGTQPMMPTLACYETATFNNTTCIWDVIGILPIMPTLACYETATFNNETCTWDVTGTQPSQPTLACYETATFNSSTCVWDITGAQPSAPTGLACYETATFNNTTCVWDVTGTQPIIPTLACYETATFNYTTCDWNVTGTQPMMPTLACYETATFNNTTCIWDVTGTQPTLGSLTVTSLGSYTWTGPYGNGTTYTTSGVYTSTVGCNIATLNLTITVNTFTTGASCGATISGLNVTINTPSVAGATSYTFRLTNLDTMAAPQSVVRLVNSVALSNDYFPGITLGTNYQIEVSVNSGPFGAPCLVKTPAPTSTIGAHCGTTVTSMNQWVYATAAASVTGYRFRITNITTSAVAIVDSSLNRFNFNQVALPVRAFATTYFVEVALRNTDGSYLPYSVGCEISTPAFPKTNIRPLQCGLPSTSYSAQLEAVIVAGATEYRFRLSNIVQLYSSVITKLINKVTLAEFAGLLPGTTYTVEVALKIDGIYGPYGSMCNVTTPGVTKAAPVVSNEFKAVAYPNPFAADFMLNITTSSESAIQIRVYDMLGKQIDNRNVEVSDIENLQVGSNYPSGVYNVIVSQGENTQTLRVIRR